MSTGGFSEQERAAIYRAIAERRDVRRGFVFRTIAPEVLDRVLGAAHAAPSVGLMQPSRFVLVRDLSTRTQIRDAFHAANGAAAAAYEIADPERAAAYRALKLEGILESDLNLCVLCDQSSAQGHGLGRQSMPEMALYSTVCAVQNLWLAARAEGIGVGWVSILDPARLRSILGVPQHLTLVAYLCVGYVDSFGTQPELERLGWESRRGLAAMLAEDRCSDDW